MDSNLKEQSQNEKKNIEFDVGKLNVSPSDSITDSLIPRMNYNDYWKNTINSVIGSMATLITAYCNLPGIKEVLNSFTKNLLESYNINFSAISESARILAARLSDILKNLHTPNISEEQKQKLSESYERWGEYGWTINPCIDFEELFESVPENKKAADLAAMKYCHKKDMPRIFEETRKCKRCKKSDYEEAIFAFENSKYKLCAFQLFSMVDAQLIRFQKKSDFDEKQKRRKVGKGAVEKAKSRAEHDLENSMILTVLFCTNLFSCLAKMFDDGNDFKIQPDVINRNFLDHGMLTRRVTRKDCIQLFLLYYNMLQLLDMSYQQGELNG